MNISDMTVHLHFHHIIWHTVHFIAGIRVTLLTLKVLVMLEVLTQDFAQVYKKQVKRIL